MSSTKWLHQRRCTASRRIYGQIHYKEEREAREGAIFCYGMGMCLGRPVWIARSESQDYDFIAAEITNDGRRFIAVQLKELSHLDPQSTFDEVIHKLARYTDSKDLTVAIRLNQAGHFDPHLIEIPSLPLAGVWVFGSIAQDQSEWAVWGDFLNPPTVGIRFPYPS